jgi:hypothetical protein
MYNVVQSLKNNLIKVVMAGLIVVSVSFGSVSQAETLTIKSSSGTSLSAPATTQKSGSGWGG